MATIPSFVSDLNKFAKQIGGEGMAVAVGVEAKKIATATASGDLGGDPKFSGWKPPLLTRFKVVPPTAIVHMPTPKSAGPWTVAEKGRNSPKNGRTHGFGTATKATSKIEAAVPKIVEAELVKVIKQTLGS